MRSLTLAFVLSLACSACALDGLNNGSGEPTNSPDAASSTSQPDASAQSSPDVQVQRGPFQSCDDNDDCIDPKAPCDTVVTCQQGICKAIPPLQFAKPGKVCDDNDACTIGDACDGKGKCAPGSKTVTCEDGGPCAKASCDPKTGCKLALLNSGACDDGNKCTEGDACASGSCKGAADTDCDDKNPCTTDSCDKAKGCVNKNNAAACSDNDKCTTGDQCEAGACKAGDALKCDDKNPCTEDTCDPKAGCKSANKDGLTCDDGLFATKNDICQSGACKGEAFYGCKVNADCGSLKSKCGIWMCVVAPGVTVGVCELTTADIPDDNNPCTTEGCTEAEGVSHKDKLGAVCDDGTACTEGDKCELKGVCKGTLKLCDDNNKCTADLCDAKAGCLFKPIDVKSVCSDGKWYTADTCEPAAGCQYKALSTDFLATQPLDFDDQYTPAVELSFAVQLKDMWVTATLPMANKVTVMLEQICPAYTAPASIKHPVSFNAYAVEKFGGKSKLVIGGKFGKVVGPSGQDLQTKPSGPVIPASDFGEEPQPYTSPGLEALCKELMAGK